MSDSVTPRTEALQAPLFFTIFLWLFKLMSIESVMPSNHLVLCCPLLLLPSMFPGIRVFPSASLSQLFESCGQSIGASASVFPVNIQGLYPLGWTGLISSQGRNISLEMHLPVPWLSMKFSSISSRYSFRITEANSVCLWDRRVMVEFAQRNGSMKCGGFCLLPAMLFPTGEALHCCIYPSTSPSIHLSIHVSHLEYVKHVSLL